MVGVDVYRVARPDVSTIDVAAPGSLTEKGSVDLPLGCRRHGADKRLKVPRELVRILCLAVARRARSAPVSAQ